MAKRPIHAVILAGGEGKRMKSAIPKVLLDLLGRPVIGHVLDAVRALKPESIVIVGGRHLPAMKVALAEDGPLNFVKQPNPKGTGHAVKFALKHLPKRGDHDVLILNGDGPLITPAALKQTLSVHRRKKAEVSVVSAEVADPTGLGRIVRDSRGGFLRIVEEKDCSDAEREIHEINAGQYVVRLPALLKLLPKIGKGNAQGEYYLTDLIELAKTRAAACLEDPDEGRGLNDPQEFDAVRRILKARLIDAHRSEGVTFLDPDLTYLEAGVYIGAGTVVHPFTVIRRGVSIAPRCSVGPMAHLRSGTVLEEDVQVGDFVEIKASTLGAGSKAMHLAYLGDAQVGKGVNVGAGSITANFDGRGKHPTTIADGASLGSNTVLVAPVKVGSNARTGAGTVVPAGQDVPPGTTVVGVPAGDPLPRKQRTKASKSPASASSSAKSKPSTARRPRGTAKKARSSTPRKSRS